MNAAHDRLEEELRALGRALAWPRADLVDAVVADVGRAPRRTRAPVSARRVALLAAVLVTLLAGTAIAGMLGVPGVRILFGGAEPAADLPPLVEVPGVLGSPASLAEARERAAFPLLVPGEPGAQVHVAGSGDRARVSFVYPATAERPAVGGSDVGAVVTEFLGAVDPDLYVKQVEAGATVLEVPVEGGASGVGTWIEGAHAVLVRDAEGQVVESVSGLSGSVLLLQRGAVTVRIEVADDLTVARALAESLRPAP